MQLRLCIAFACAAFVGCSQAEPEPGSPASRAAALGTDPPVDDATIDLEVDAVPAPDVDMEIDTVLDPEVDTVPAPDIDPDTDTDTDLEVEVDTDTDLEVDTDTDLEVDTDTDLEVDTDTDTDPDTDTDLEVDTDTDLEVDTDTDLEVDTDTDLEVDTDVETTDTDPDTGPETAGDTGPDTETCAGCDDHNACNGLEGCDADGHCVPGTAIDCDDSKVCTTDSCNTANGNCSNTTDLTQCACSGVPVSNTYTASFSLEDAQTSCPIIGGTAGFTTALAFNGSYTQPHCGNSCQSDLTVSGSLTSSLLLCKESLALTGAASYTGTDTACPGCNTTTCQKNCDGGGSCKQNTFSATASLTYTKFYGYQMKEKKAGTEVEIKCGASLSGTPSVSLSGSRKTNNGYTCGDCTDCLQGNGSLGFGVAGSVGCFISFNIFNGLFKQTLGCPSCGAIGLDVYGGVQGQRGACGGRMCAYAGAKARASATTPCVGFSIGFIGFAAQCTASASACAEGSGCGTCSTQCSGCAQATGGLSCSVSSSGTCP